MGVTRDDVIEALSTVNYPGFSRDLVAFGVVRHVEVRGSEVEVSIDLGAGDRSVSGQIEREAREAVEAIPGVRAARVVVTSAGPSGGGVGSSVPPGTGLPPPPSSSAVGPSQEEEPLPAVRHIVAIASGKGGVGKSTVAVNLAVAAARKGLRVGLMDADIYGPSIPLMMGVRDEKPTLTAGGRRIATLERFGVRFMSIGFFVPQDSAVIWRGPMVMKAVEQLLRDVEWGVLDLLVVDMPPGTGDAQLTLSQKARLAGAVIVTTPQDVALADATKGVAMFRRVEVPVLGIVENMSYFTCPHCGGRSEIFGHGGGRAEAERLGVPFLGEIPLDAAIRDGGDAGYPLVAREPSSPRTEAFDRIASQILESLR